MWIVIISILIDQISKYLVCNIKETITVVPKLLSIEYIENYGAVFGIMQGSNSILALVSLSICIAIIVYILRLKKRKEKIPLAWYFILAGGIGNLIDRLVRGYVVDFIATPFIATFNIADSLVVIGVFLIAIREIWNMIKNSKEEKNES